MFDKPIVEMLLSDCTYLVNCRDKPMERAHWIDAYRLARMRL